MCRSSGGICGRARRRAGAADTLLGVVKCAGDHRLARHASWSGALPAAEDYYRALWPDYYALVAHGVSSLVRGATRYLHSRAAATPQRGSNGEKEADCDHRYDNDRTALPAIDRPQSYCIITI